MGIYQNILYRLTMRKSWLVPVVSTSVGLLYYIYLYYSAKGVAPSVNSSYSYALLSVLVANVIGLIISRSDKKLDQWIPWRKYMAGRLLLGIVFNSLVAISMILLLGWLFLFVSGTTAEFDELWSFHYETILKLGIITLAGVIIYTVIYFALFSYKQYAVVQVDHVKGRRKQLQLQFEALKSQLSPHYLFNCLNTISSLIFKDPNLAEDFIRRLAETYQYILGNNEKQFVTLQEEVEFVKAYNYLLQVRFENNLRIEINLPPNIMDSKMPPLTLQMLVENAVKHNIITREHPLDIYIHAIDNTDIRVTNSKTTAPANVNSFHVGLDNIKKRYGYFTRRQIKVEDTHKFTIQLPVIHEIARSA